MRRGNRNHHAVIGAANLQGQIIARNLIIHFLAAMGATQGSFDERYGIVRSQRQAKRQQGCLRVA